VLGVEAGLPAATRDALARRGHDVKEVRGMGAVQAVLRRAEGFDGAADPRKGGGVAGW
jgi:gamma-glutamyltranspeptidase